MTSKDATIQYRYLPTEKLWPDFHLKDMLADVLQRSGGGGSTKLYQSVASRKLDLDGDGSVVILNKLSDPSTWNNAVICGQLIHVKNGTELPAIIGDLDQNIPEFSLQNLSIGTHRQLVEGVLYFAIAHNHVGLIEGQRTRARTLERYLTRLFQDAGELNPGEVIMLNAKLEGNVREVKQVSVTPTRVPGRKATPGGASDAKSAGQAQGEGSTVMDVLRALGWNEGDISTLQNQVPEDGWIEGKFNMVFKQKRKSATVDRQALEAALRNLDPEAIGLLGAGSREKGGVIKLSEKKPIPIIGDLLDPEAAMNEIVGMLQRWANTGRIDYDFAT